MSIMQNKQTYPRLLADIGGTNARFAVEFSPNTLKHIEILACKDYATIIDAVRAYLFKIGNPSIRFGAFALANPVVGDWVQMTNHHWAFSIEETKIALGLDVLMLVNDFIAQAYAITKIQARELVQIGGSVCALEGVKAVLGPGTGLGVSAIIPCANGKNVVLATEGGHTSFSPFDDMEVKIWQYAKKRFRHISAERFLSGSGLVLIYEALASFEGIKNIQCTPESISKEALSGKSSLSRLALDKFCAMLGTISSNVALTLGARGGVYLCGGIIPRFVDYFKESPFRERFEDKGRFQAYLAEIPVYVVLAKNPGIIGVSIALENNLKEKGKI